MLKYYFVCPAWYGHIKLPRLLKKNALDFIALDLQIECDKYTNGKTKLWQTMDIQNVPSLTILRKRRYITMR